MLRYFETTTLILLWCAGLSVLWSHLLFQRRLRRPPQPFRSGADAGLGGVILPALVVAPLALVTAYRSFGVNLLYPLHLFANLGQLAAAAIVPALVLSIASGLSSRLRTQVDLEVDHWHRQPFATLALAVGQSPWRTLRRLVIVRSLATAWSMCLPWLFGELIVVENVFNAPGLGLEAWTLARNRDVSGLLSALVWIAGLYGCCVFLAALVNRRLGRLLEGYV